MILFVNPHYLHEVGDEYKWDKSALTISVLKNDWLLDWKAYHMQAWRPHGFIDSYAMYDAGAGLFLLPSPPAVLSLFLRLMLVVLSSS
jgi:hypothetical protein